jgi:hypothetical protein
VCGSKLADDSLRCTNCGAAYGEKNRCPHCKSVADVEPSDALGFRCRVCGGPRVPVDDARVVQSGREIPLLERAQRARVKRAGYRVAAGVVGGFGALSVLVSLLVLALVNPGIFGVIGMLMVTAVPFVLAALAFGRAGRETRELEQTLDQAWSLVASDVLSSVGRELTAGELAKALRVSEPRADELLAKLNASDFVHARVTDAGELVYSSRIGGTSAERVRVADATEPAATLESGTEDALPEADRASAKTER